MTEDVAELHGLLRQSLVMLEQHHRVSEGHPGRIKEGKSLHPTDWLRRDIRKALPPEEVAKADSYDPTKKD